MENIERNFNIVIPYYSGDDYNLMQIDFNFNKNNNISSDSLLIKDSFEKVLSSYNINLPCKYCIDTNSDLISTLHISELSQKVIGIVAAFLYMDMPYNDLLIEESLLLVENSVDVISLSLANAINSNIEVKYC